MKYNHVPGSVKRGCCYASINTNSSLMIWSRFNRLIRPIRYRCFFFFFWLAAAHGLTGVVVFTFLFDVFNCIVLPATGYKYSVAGLKCMK